MSQTPQATFGVRCTQLAPKHGGPQTAQIESCPPFSHPSRTYEEPLPHFFSHCNPPTTKIEDVTKGEGKESEMLAGKSSSCLSNRAKQELASKRLKAGSLIWGQTECIKRWLLLSVMTTSCAPMFNYFSVMSLPTFHCSSRRTAFSSRSTGGGQSDREPDNVPDWLIFRTTVWCMWKFSLEMSL